MPQSSRFRALTSRLAVLRNHLLPRKLSPTGVYTLRQLDRVRGYRLLVHAEFEAFIEERCWDLAKTAIRDWKADGKARHAIMALLAKCEKSDRTGTLGECIGAAGQAYYHVIQQNHGIRESNLLTLLGGIGVERADLDPAWLSTVDSFGVARGEVAHNTVGTHQPIDPATELATVKLIREGFADLDDILSNRAGG